MNEVKFCIQLSQLLHNVNGQDMTPIHTLIANNLVDMGYGGWTEDIKGMKFIRLKLFLDLGECVIAHEWEHIKGKRMHVNSILVTQR